VEADGHLVSVVLGGTGGIGAAVARRLAGPGARLVLVHLERQARAEALARELASRGAEATLVRGNVAEAGTLAAVAERVGAWGGRCHHLVHSVAVTSFKPLSAVRPNQWSLILDVSARSLLDWVGALVEPLARARGAVVAVSSHGAVRFVPDYGALGPAKAALEAVVRQLACELAPRGIRVNAVRAGLVESEVLRRMSADVRREAERRTPSGRIGTPDEIAAVIVFLLGADAAWVVGQVVEVDGGMSLT
jgi:enoyl-[acyl-carrier protein] reductase III